MSTVIRSKLSKRNKYYISENRYRELKYFCLQYDEWLTEYNNLNGYSESNKFDPTSSIAIRRYELKKMMDIVKECAIESDDYIGNYIFESVTKNRTFTYFKTIKDIPCGKDMYYDRYRKFFFILSNKLIRVL